MCVCVCEYACALIICTDNYIYTEDFPWIAANVLNCYIGIIEFVISRPLSNNLGKEHITFFPTAVG